MADTAPLDNRGARLFERSWLGILLAILFLLTNFLVTDFACDFADQSGLFAKSHWNWFGKISSIGFSCALLALSPWLRQNVGLRWRQSPGSARLSIGCYAVFIGCAAGIGFLQPPTAFSADTLIYQFFVPAIDEELMMRGILLAMLERAFGQSPMSCQLRFGCASLITSLVFGIGHAVSIEDGRFHFAVLIFSITTIWAAVVALVRTRSGSLMWPIMLHGAWDGSIFLVPMVR